LPSSIRVAIKPAPGDTGRPCGVDYELKAYVLEENENEPHRRNTVRLAIRKVQFAPVVQGPQPTSEISKRLLLSDKPINLEATLDKELYYHGETLSVNVQITNNSSRSVKKIKISVRQFADICLYSSAQYKCQVAGVDCDVHVPPSSTLCKVFQITPTLSDNKDKRGLALDGQLKHEDTNLASSTLLREEIPRENLGILVSYKVKVKLVMNGIGGDVTLMLPFSLMHSKPTNDSDNQRRENAQNAGTIRKEISSQQQEIRTEANRIIDNVNASRQNRKVPDLETASINLISFDDTPARNDVDNMPGMGDTDDDFVFEEFARIRLANAEADGAANALNENGPENGATWQQTA